MERGDSASFETAREESCWWRTAKSVAKIAIPTLLIATAIIGTGYYGVTRIESFLDVKLDAIAANCSFPMNHTFS